MQDHGSIGILDSRLERSICTLLDIPVTATELQSQARCILDWGCNGSSKAVFLANVHMLIEARNNSELRAALHSANLVAPDGMPLVWMLRWIANPNQQRVAGFDLMMEVCQQATTKRLGIFLLGSENYILEAVQSWLEKEFSGIRIVGVQPMPFRPVTQAENELITQEIKYSGASIVFVSLGCPKQEIWISENHQRVPAVFLGVGAVFPIMAGVYARAPRIIRSSGFEWLYRLLQDPKRLWKRYATTIPPFVVLAILQVFRSILRK